MIRLLVPFSLERKSNQKVQGQHERLRPFVRLTPPRLYGITVGYWFQKATGFALLSESERRERTPIVIAKSFRVECFVVKNF